MAIIDVVKYEVNERELVYKFPSDDLRIGTQLIVYTGQTAFFVKDGIICDQFEAGSYTINTQNIQTSTNISIDDLLANES